MAGLLPEWMENYVVHPMAYGGDQAANDLFGERGLLGMIPDSLGTGRWHPVVPEPENKWASLGSEIPRSIITSGGLVGSSRAFPAVVGGMISGFARDPGELSAQEDWRARATNAQVGGMGAYIGNSVGGAIGRGLEKGYRAIFAPEANAAIREYGATGVQFAGAKKWHQDPANFQKHLDQLPTARGTFRRGIRPDHPTELAQIENLKPGDIYEPGKSLSMDDYGLESDFSAWGKVNELDEVVEAGAKARGPYVHVTSNNARDATGVLGWEEVITRPGAKFRVTKVVRNKEGKITDLYVEDLTSPGFGRQVNDVAKEGVRTTVQQSFPGALQGVKRRVEHAKKP